MTFVDFDELGDQDAAVVGWEVREKLFGQFVEGHGFLSSFGLVWTLARAISLSSRLSSLTWLARMMDSAVPKVISGWYSEEMPALFSHLAVTCGAEISRPFLARPGHLADASISWTTSPGSLALAARSVIWWTVSSSAAGSN